MKYRYTKYTGDALDDLDLEDLVAKLSDLLLSSGFGSPYAMDEAERTMQALHDAILDALFNGGVLPEETIERLLGDPKALIDFVASQPPEVTQVGVETGVGKIEPRLFHVRPHGGPSVKTECSEIVIRRVAV